MTDVLAHHPSESVVRTAVNHVSNVARDDVFAANSDIIAGVKWVSTLDGRTSAICRGRDGHVAPTPGREDELPADYPRLVPSNVRPPAHWGCRSTVVAVFDLAMISEQLGERPYVRDSRTRKQREIDFRAEAKADVGEAEWKRLGEEGRKPLIKAKRDAWAEANIGRVPAGVTYDEWLRKQPDRFQDKVLGKQKADLFRQGLKLDRFVDQVSKEMTLPQLIEASGLNLKPSIKINVKGDVSKGFDEGIRETMAQMPPSVTQALQDANVKIRAGKSIVSLEPKLKGQRPRGWTEDDGTWENCGGAYDPKKKHILLGEYIENESGELVRHPDIFFTLRHEIGHAWGELEIQGSPVNRHVDLLAAFKIEVANLRLKPESTQADLAYFLQEDENASLEEFVAQGFAMLTGTSGKNSINSELQRAFSESLKLLRRFLK